MFGALFFSHEGIFFAHKSVTRLDKKECVISEQDDRSRSRSNLIFTFFLSYFVESDSESNPPDDEGEVD